MFSQRQGADCNRPAAHRYQKNVTQITTPISWEISHFSIFSSSDDLWNRILLYILSKFIYTHTSNIYRVHSLLQENRHSNCIKLASLLRACSVWEFATIFIKDFHYWLLVILSNLLKHRNSTFVFPTYKLISLAIGCPGGKYSYLSASLSSQLHVSQYLICSPQIALD